MLQNCITLGQDVFTVVMLGVYEDSQIHKYAKQNNIPYILLEKNGRVPLKQAWFDTTEVKEWEYTGETILPKLKFKAEEASFQLEEERDYKFEYGENTEPGTGTVKILGLGIFTGSLEFEFKITARGWIDKNGYKLFYDEDGQKAIGFKTINESVYYFESDGKMSTGDRIIEGKLYCFREDGRMVTGFYTLDDATYYFTENGPLTGLQEIGPNEDTYYFDTDGRMLTGGKVVAFVARCYQLILNREPDAGGLQGWSDALESRTAAAAQIIDGFVRSPEYINRNLSDGESVDILYKTMLDRAADEGGKAGWTDALSQGYTLQHIINGFCGSEEFTAICNNYGIVAGSVAVSGTMVKREAITPEGDEAEAPVVYKGYNSEFINEEKIGCLLLSPS